jgi:hypothetical protein
MLASDFTVPVVPDPSADQLDPSHLAMFEAETVPALEKDPPT